MGHLFEIKGEAAPVRVTMQMAEHAIQQVGELVMVVTLEADNENPTVTIIGDSNPETVGNLLNGLVTYLGDQGVAGLIAHALQNYQTARSFGFVGPDVQGPPAAKKKPCDGCPDDDISAG